MIILQVPDYYGMNMNPLLLKHNPKLCGNITFIFYVESYSFNLLIFVR